MTRIGVISDVHYTSARSAKLAYHNPFDVDRVLERVQASLTWFADASVDVVVLAGDLAHHGQSDELRHVLRTVTDAWPGRVLVVAGNHDVLVHEDAIEQAVADGADRVEIGSSRVWQLAGLRIAGLAPGDVAGWTGPDDDDTSPLVLISHFPVTSRAQAFAHQGLDYPGDLPGIDRIADQLSARSAPTIVVTGHLHARDADLRSQVLQLTVGPLVEPPFEATIVELRVRGTAIDVRRWARPMLPRLGQADPALAPTDQHWTLEPPRR